MANRNKNETLITPMFSRWFPIVFSVAIIYFFPPIALGVILAFFSSPLLNAVTKVTKLPIILATIVVISLFILFFSTFIFISFHGLVEILPVLEHHLFQIANREHVDDWIVFLEGKVVEFGQAILDFSLQFMRTFFQHMMNLLLFLIAFFFALKESGKNRFWFLIYFPSRFRKQAKRSLTKASQLIGTFIAIETKLIFITFVILTVGFFLLQFPSPLGLGLIISLADSLPFLGIGLFLLPMIFYFVVSEQFFIAISLGILYLVTIIIRQFAESYLWATTFQLKAIHAFFLLACAIYAFGFVGILLTPFLMFLANKLKHHASFNE